jgi:hypothetical protein
LETTIAATASHRSPRPTSASAAVASTQAVVLNIRRRFLQACRSACAPRPGIVNITIRLEAAITIVQASVAQSAPPAATPTK